MFYKDVLETILCIEKRCILINYSNSSNNRAYYKTCIIIHQNMWFFCLILAKKCTTNVYKYDQFIFKQCIVEIQRFIHLQYYFLPIVVLGCISLGEKNWFSHFHLILTVCVLYAESEKTMLMKVFSGVAFQKTKLEHPRTNIIF